MHPIIRKVLAAAGFAAIAVVLFSPLSGVAEHLFAAHMMQHLLIIAVAAPSLAASGVLDGLRRTVLVEMAVQPVKAWIAFVGVFLFWHWPAAFQWAAHSEASILLEHASILATALLFWSVVFSPKGEDWMSYGARALFVMTAAVATDLPGVIMVFSPTAFCTMPGETAGAWGLTPLEDQQVAGMLMWVPANLIFFSIATFLFARWISDSPHPSTHHPVHP